MSNLEWIEELQHQIADLSKTIERLQEQLESDEMALTESQEIIAELKAQLNEANEVIKNTKQITGNIDLSQFDYEHRRKIDGITMETDSYLEKYNIS